MKDEDYPALYVAANASSKSAQKWFFGALRVNLMLLVLGTILSVINYPHQLFAISQLLILLTLLSITIYLGYENPQKAWYANRALAESLKTLTWRYMMRAEPFDLSDQRAKHLFVESAKKILSANRQAMGKSVEMSSFGQITQIMNQNRASDLESRKYFYLSKRIDDQLAWYQSKASLNKNLSRNWFAILIASNVLGVLFAIFRISHPATEYWPTELFLSIAGATLAWLQSNRFQELEASYSLTAQDISLLKELVPAGKDEGKFSMFVADSENAFSREHTQWQARRDES
jgi:SMODS and SLOG-associating 2TM effector domain 3/SMODS and SLOG-associating 2TM effector domain 1